MRVQIALVVAALSALSPAVTPQALPPEVLAAARAVTTNRDLLKRLSLYTCLETISRTRPTTRRGSGSRDILQLDVGVGEHEELYSWPGDTTFSSMDLGELVGHGVVFTGMFAIFARNLFVDGNGIVKAAGEGIVQGRRALHFTYRTPSLNSRWLIRWEGKDGELGEAGQFWVDAEDFHLLRLAASAQDIPPRLLLESLDLVIEYQISETGEEATLVPTSGSLTAIELGGKKYVNIVEFSHCHIFQAESKLSTSDEPVVDVLTRYKRQMGTLPTGVSFAVALEEPIRMRNAKVGDPVTARLEQAVKISPGVSVPAGSLLRGRIRQLEKLEQPANTIQVGIAFAELEGEQVTYRFFAELIGMEPLPGISSQLTTNRPHISSSMLGGIQSITGETLVPLAIPGAAVFFLSDTTSIPKGFRMTWRTTKMDR